MHDLFYAAQIENKIYMSVYAQNSRFFHDLFGRPAIVAKKRGDVVNVHHFQAPVSIFAASFSHSGTINQ
jgi:hypothetical protein